TVFPGAASSRRGGIPMGLRMLSRVAAYRLSQSWGRQGGSATVVPGINTSVLSGTWACIRPWPYSNSSFMGSSLFSQINFYDLQVFRRIESDLPLEPGEGDKAA